MAKVNNTQEQVFAQDSVTIDSEPWNYTVFDSMHDVAGFVQECQKSPKMDASRKAFANNEDYVIDKDEHEHRYGRVFDSPEELKEHRTFQNLDLIPQVRKEVEASLASFMKLASESVDEQKKMAWNPYGFGVFVFDKCAPSLYTELHNAKGEIVPYQDAQMRNAAGKVIPSDVALTMLRGERDKWESIMRKEPLTEEFSATIEDVYAYFPMKESVQRSVKLYLLAGNSYGVKGKEMLYNSMAAVALAEYLDTMGIGLEINIVTGAEYNGQGAVTIVKAKQFTDYLDINLLSLLTSDPANFRYYGFANIIATWDHFRMKIPSSLGYPPDVKKIRKLAKQIEQKADTSGRVFPIVLERATSLSEAKNAVLKAVEEYTQMLEAADRAAKATQ
jgi:hypothetical protein